ncbi:NADP-dependent oxidoreductase [Schumannella luteola]|uniref:NADPH:quinone reductase-like Zn-dependent oxidoreductase n=1 Tax=Schumannella luteola TaxID=472059 RepID=A0A852YEP6_9MICO|nr:NADP-dependent oxidoreductase [Schumannella luteola]NYG99774.1 NADPH:quinone reductase-like Zn-dependent oxidoreductase [Schumannella luteola]TPX06549.1 NADP-dependent oxidoreductase [Schumannella luteola]
MSTADRAVRFHRLAGVDSLQLDAVEATEPGPGQIRVRVVTAGLNPVDWKILSGSSSRYSPTLPSVNGNDFAGVIDRVGAGVTERAVGDRVFGGARFHAQADHLVVAADAVVAIPDEVPFAVAGVLDIAGRTAWASVASFGLGPQDTVFISGAAGGVGVFSSQLARRTGARVIGSCGADNDELLRGLGVEPVRYGDGLEQRLRDLAPDGITAVLDQAGHGTIELALALGVAAHRINTITDPSAVERLGVTNIGGHSLTPGLPELGELAALVAGGQVRVPIDAEFPLEQFAAAYAHLRGGHLSGKVLLRLIDDAAIAQEATTW